MNSFITEILALLGFCPHRKFLLTKLFITVLLPMVFTPTLRLFVSLIGLIRKVGIIETLFNVAFIFTILSSCLNWFIFIGIVLVTDAMSALGLQPGLYKLGNQDVNVNSNCAVLAGTDTLCGAIASMDQCIRYFKNATGIYSWHPSLRHSLNL